MPNEQDADAPQASARLLPAESSGSDGETDRKEPVITTETASSTKSTDSKQTAWYRLWWVEIGALLMSIACLAANVVVLRSLDGREYSNWQIRGIQNTFNTLISIVATISKSALPLPVGEGIAQLKWSTSTNRCDVAAVQDVNDRA